MLEQTMPWWLSIPKNRNRIKSIIILIVIGGFMLAWGISERLSTAFLLSQGERVNAEVIDVKYSGRNDRRARPIVRYKCAEQEVTAKSSQAFLGSSPMPWDTIGIFCDPLHPDRFVIEWLTWSLMNWLIIGVGVLMLGLAIISIIFPSRSKVKNTPAI